MLIAQVLLPPEYVQHPHRLVLLSQQQAAAGQQSDGMILPAMQLPHVPLQELAPDQLVVVELLGAP